MALNFVDRLGNWNPQLLRELKGCLKIRSVLVVITTSLLSQYLLFQSFQLLLFNLTGSTSKYCLRNNDPYTCVKNGAGDIIIDWHLWWLDIFVSLSMIGIFTLLVAGTYMLIANLAQEERRGTLNFIRLSPQSSQSILVGKLLGVPILLYLAVALAIPLYLWSGLSAQIPLGEILAFGGVFIFSCILFYSAALLYSLTTRWLSGFQAWVGSGTVLTFLTVMYLFAVEGSAISSSNSVPFSTPLDWLRLFGVFDLIPHLSFSSFHHTTQNWLDASRWFYLPVGSSSSSLIGFALLNCGLWSYWIWQGLKRCFRNPNATILSKWQSYLMVACFEVSALGFTLQRFSQQTPSKDWLLLEFDLLCCLNWLLFLYLLAALSPQRQALQDWARYRRENRKGFWHHALVQDLIWGEKSPAIIAIAINLIIAITPASAWILLSPAQSTDKNSVLCSLALFASLVLVYTVITQLMLLMKTQNQMFWATGTMAAMVILPPIILGVLSAGFGKPLNLLWLFSVFAPIAVVTPGGLRLTAMDIFLSLLCQWSMLGLLNLLLTRQLRQLGESASKALFAEHPSLPGG